MSAFHDLFRRCLARDPKVHPPFAIIVRGLDALRTTKGLNMEKVASPQSSSLQELVEEHYLLHASPDMWPGPLPSLDDFDKHWRLPPPEEPVLPEIPSHRDLGDSLGILSDRKPVCAMQPTMPWSSLLARRYNNEKKRTKGRRIKGEEEYKKEEETATGMKGHKEG
ncbi:hypothetical protein BDQ17DRAFT_1429141 [Cyathus striatus]|nr:hypothetical protein BDQ17DRAFT_1429141 [Cyathus striatus]